MPDPRLYLVAAAAVIMVVMAMALTRAVLGPSVYDRALAVNMFGTKTVLLISVIDFLGGRQAFLDIALAYALINFISVIAMLKFYRYTDQPCAGGRPASGEGATLV